MKFSVLILQILWILNQKKLFIWFGKIENSFGKSLWEKFAYILRKFQRKSWNLYERKSMNLMMSGDS